MIHPSYSELMKVVNSEVETGEEPVINSRYSIVMATAKRARQLVAGKEAYVPERQGGKFRKPLSIAVDELNRGLIKIVGEDYVPDQEQQAAANEDAKAAQSGENQVEAEGAQ